MEMFGVSGPLGSIALAITATPVGAFLISSGTIAVEIAIAVLIWVPGKARVLAVAFSSALHLAIIALIGIGSFGLIMIGLVFTSAFSVDMFADRRGARGRTAPAVGSRLTRHSKPNTLSKVSGGE
ncbi:hypothetical protein ACRAWC_09610 [Leifsonia sp. L25]|uniref:hypothetical protein n=1 Tax=Actinomycetes TaxID=1760 RepID=UPI003D69072E